MEGFLNSFQPIFSKYKIESLLILLSLVIAIISGAIFLKSSPENNKNDVDVVEEKGTAIVKKIFVDIAGAVEKPGVYEATSGARLQDVVVMAGGLSTEADANFFSRNFNLARYVNDQDKIYIPFSSEIYSGIFIENQRTLDYVSAAEIPVAAGTKTSLVDENNNQQQLKININSALLEELDTLPGVGQVTAQKIINSRPYGSIEELISKKAVKKNIFENIKNQITVN